jgi:hypothetical protein
VKAFVFTVQCIVIVMAFFVCFLLGVPAWVAGILAASVILLAI